MAPVNHLDGTRSSSSVDECRRDFDRPQAGTTIDIGVEELLRMRAGGGLPPRRWRQTLERPEVQQHLDANVYRRATLGPSAVAPLDAVR